MANHLRYRSGPVQLVKSDIDSTSLIEPGDMLFLDSTEARPASEFVWNTDLPTTQTGFSNSFLGIAHERSEVGDDAPISVDLSPQSVYEFDVDVSSYTLGTLLGPDESSSTLMNQQLEAVVPAAQAVARCMEFTDGFVTRARVSFASAYGTGSANAAAAIG